MTTTMYTKYTPSQCSKDAKVPTICGCIKQNGYQCTSRPTYKTTDGVWACGNHIKQKVPVCECSICMDDCLPKECVVTPCNHMFHRKCITKWLDTGNDSCPLCRTIIQERKINIGSVSLTHNNIVLIMYANLAPEEAEHVLYVDAYHSVRYFPLNRESYHNGEWLPDMLRS